MTHSEPCLFVTDYASYNEGTQFEFGHWVKLTDFSNANDFSTYLFFHFKECDEKRPLGCGSQREEYMFTDYENFPLAFYSESMSGDDMKRLFMFIELSDEDKRKVAYLLDQGESVDYALSFYENVYMGEYDGTNRAKWDLFHEFYPEAEIAEQSNEYLTIDYDRFINEKFNEFEYNGTRYLVERYY